MSETTTLPVLLLRPGSRPELVADCVTALEEEVASKTGIGGMALKGAYRSVKAIQPGFIPAVMNALLEEWSTELDGEFQAWKKDGGGQPFEGWLLDRKEQVADQMLAVTDRRAERSVHVAAKKVYMKLRPKAKEQVLVALPRVSRVLSRYLEDT